MKKNLKPDAIAFPTPVYIVGTYGKDGEPTAMNVAWGGVCSSEPPCVMIAVRRERYTYDNIMERKAFTVNFPDAAHVKEADYLGLISGKKVRKLEAAGLRAEKGQKVDAPVIQEFPFALECQYVKSVEIGRHVMIVGEIVSIAADEDCLTEKGAVDIEKAKPLAYNPAANQYNAIGEVVAKAFSVGVDLLPKK